ncbi:MAG: right-handed parallel beta-helix repeat-containing protein [Verrucomicrobiota bacterium]
MAISSAVMAADFYVAPGGQGAGDGSRGRPFATLEQSRDAIRALKSAGALPVGGVTVWLQPGIHVRSQAFELNAGDSGTATAPIVYRAAVGSEVRLHAGRQVKPTDFTAVVNPALVKRLDPAARGKLVQLNLAALGVAHCGPYPKVFNNGGGIIELYFNDQNMPLSRWPNQDSTTMEKVLDKGDWSNGPTRHGGVFIAREDRLARWPVDKGVWLEGYWRVPWEPQTVLVKSINAANREITFAEPVNAGIGSKYAKAGEKGDGKEPWCAVNLLEEIDQPGEWCIDFNSKTLFFWPPGDLSRANIYVSDLDQPLIILKEVSHVTLRGFVVEGGMNNGVEISGGASNLVAGCTFRNLAGSGVTVRGGLGHAVRSSDFYMLGHGGIYLSGGDRKTLTPAGHVAENNHLHHLGLRKKTYAAGIHIGAYGGTDAVGCRAAHNLIHDLPHAGVLYGGNDHLLEYNEVYRVVLTSGDMGAFYTYNDWTSQGNLVRYNFVHDSPRANAFYMDDGDSGDTIYGNVVYRLFYGPFIGGGHENMIMNNLIIETERAIHFDSRGVSRGYATNKNLTTRLLAAKVQEPPWSTRYPLLPKLLTARRDLPLENFITNNVTVRCKQTLHLSGKKEELQYSTVRDNLDLGTEDPSFVDAARLNFQLKSDSLIYKKLGSFKPVPFEQIGLQRDEYRTSIPPRTSGQSEDGKRGGVFDSNTDLQQSNKPVRNK